MERDLLSFSQDVFPPSVLTFVREIDGRCPIVSLNRVYAGVPGNSLNRETVNLNEEKLKPRGKNELQRFSKKCEGKKKRNPSMKAILLVLNSSRHFFAAINVLISLLLGS